MICNYIFLIYKMYNFIFYDIKFKLTVEKTEMTELELLKIMVMQKINIHDLKIDLVFFIK